jgi:hypothetical protein
MKMIGPLPIWIFVPLVILASLLALLALVGFGVLMWRGAAAFKMCFNEEIKGRQQQQQGQFITGGAGPAGGAAEGLIKQPGGGYLPTQGCVQFLLAGSCCAGSCCLILHQVYEEATLLVTVELKCKFFCHVLLRCFVICW